MCVIIQRNPGIVVPYDKLEIACDINKHGYGFIVNDREKFSVIKDYDPKGNDPQLIARLLEDAHDCQVALHLRFATAGKIDLDNAHPYQVLKKETDGVDLWFMHNGTLDAFKAINPDYSDSRNLNNAVLHDLFKAAFDKEGPDQYLKAPWVHLILKNIKNTTSAFTFNDSLGQRLIIQSQWSKEFEGWWSSNEYSFRETHTRYSQGWTQKGYALKNGVWTKEINEKAEEVTTTHPTAGTSRIVNTVPTSGIHGGSTKPATPAQRTSISYDLVKSPLKHLENPKSQWIHTLMPQKPRIVMSAALKKEAEVLKEYFGKMLTEPYLGDNRNVKLSTGGAVRPKFKELAKIDNLRVLLRLDEQTFKDLVNQNPEAAVILIQDLLEQAYAPLLRSDNHKDIDVYVG